MSKTYSFILQTILILIGLGIQMMPIIKSWAPSIIICSIAVLWFIITMIYWACKRKPPIQIVHSEVGIDMDSKIPEIIIFLTFLSEKDVSLDKLIQLSLSDKITKKIKLVIDFNPYFYLGSERSLFLKSGKAEITNDRRVMSFHTKNNKKIEKAIHVLRQGIRDGQYSIKYKTVEGRAYIYKGKKH